MVIRRALASLSLVVVGIGALVGLEAVGRLPWLGVDWSDPIGWASTTPTEDAIASLVLAAAMGVVGYVTLSAALYAVAQLSDGHRLLRAVRWMTLPPVRRLIDGVVAISVAAASFGSPAAFAAEPRPPLIYDIVDGIPIPRGDPVGLESIDSTTAQDEPTDITPPGTTGAGYTPVAAGDGTDSPDEEAPPGHGVDEPEGAVERTHVVVEGDSMWSIARLIFTDEAGDDTLADVTEYWLRLIDANRERIRSGNPDLIYPGEVLVVPHSGARH